MANRSIRLSVLVCALLTVGLVGCKRAEETGAPATPPATPPVASAAPFRVTSVDLGNSIDANKRVTAPATQFAPGDTIYASVATDGAAAQVTIVARWTYEDGQLVDESSLVIAPTGPAATEFHIAKPDGLPSGKYKVEVTANGKPAGAGEFEVK